MRLLITMSSISRMAGGLYSSVRHLAKNLTDKGVQIDVLALQDRYAEEDSGAWAPVVPRVFKSMDVLNFRFSPQLIRAVMANKYADMVHSHGLWQSPDLAAYLWACRHKKPSIVSPHGMLDAWAVGHSKWKKRMALALFEREHIENAACLHALTEQEMNSLRTFGLNNPVCVIPNGVDLPPQEEVSSGNGPLMPPGLPAGDKRKMLFYLGRLHPKKNLPNLLHAWALLCKQKPVRCAEWVLVIAGWDESGHRHRLEQLIKDLRIQSSVILPGPLYDEAKDAWYRRVSAFVLPSMSEGLPVSVLEAWSYSVPVLMTEQCNLPKGFETQAAIKTGIDVQSISRGLDELTGMPAVELAAMGCRGRRLVAEEYSWDRISSRMLLVYKWLVGGGARPDCVFT